LRSADRRQPRLGASRRIDPGRPPRDKLATPTRRHRFAASARCHAVPQRNPVRSSCRMPPFALHPPRAAAKGAGKPATKPSGKAGPALGRLPTWNLADLYPAIDAPQVKRDLDRADAECAAFEEAYKGKLGALA